MEIFSDSPAAFAIIVFAEVDDTLTDGYFIAGFDSDPATVLREVGTTTHTGEVDASLRRDNHLDAFASGSANMTVDFDAETVSGFVILTQDNPADADYRFPDSDLGFDESKIAQNGNAGTTTRDDGWLGGSQVEGGYDGRFFGHHTETLGGTFHSRITVDIFDDDIFMTVYFLTDKRDE